MEKDRQVTFVKSRTEIVEMMEKLYKLNSQHKIDLAKVIIITDALDWVISDSNYLDDLISDCENVNAKNI